MPYNYVRKPTPKCPKCGRLMERQTQRTYYCPIHGLIGVYPKGARDRIKVFIEKHIEDSWMDSTLGDVRPGKTRIFCGEVFLREAR